MIEISKSSPEGNVFCIIVKAQGILRAKGMNDKAKELQERVQNSHSYDKALEIIKEYVPFEFVD